MYTEMPSTSTTEALFMKGSTREALFMTGKKIMSMASFADKFANWKKKRNLDGEIHMSVEFLQNHY